MERLAGMLLKRPVLLLATLALAVTTWLAVKGNTSPCSRDAALGELPCADGTKATTGAAVQSVPRGLPVARDSVRRLRPPGEAPGLVAAAFPADDDAPERNALLETTGAPEGRTGAMMDARAEPGDGPPELPAATLGDPIGVSESAGEVGPILQGPNAARDTEQPTPIEVAPAGPVESPGVQQADDPQQLSRSTGSLLLPTHPVRRRSEQLERIARQADRQIRQGFDLAGRKAHFAARSRLVEALRLVAEGLDAEQQTAAHSHWLSAGLTALKEADDFLPGSSALEAELDVPGIIRGHLTPVLKDRHSGSLTPMEALGCYTTFAQEQLAAAAGHEVAGSMALHALGKLYGALGRESTLHVKAAEPKAIACYQAALLAFPRNYLAAHDLGVLLARCGDYRRAEAFVAHSLSIHQHSIGWRNLAVIYGQMGQAELARRAGRLSAAVRQANATGRKTLANSSHPPVRWLDPAAFVQTYDGTSPALHAAPVRQPGTTAGGRPEVRPTPAASSATGSIADWPPWKLFRKTRK